MYHYVRNLKESRYPNIKGLEFNLFKEQIFFFQKHYNFVTMEMVIDALENNTELPPKALLLTFDDAYAEHFNLVFPFLNHKKIQGSFYVPVQTIQENLVLDVNKIHFILASSNNTDALLERTFSLLDNYRQTYNLDTNENYFKKLAVESRLDTKEVIFFKRLLQKELPLELRASILKILFEETVNIEETVFSKELYLNEDQLKCMIDNGMHIGHHGFNHRWLNSLKPEEQEIEIIQGLNFLEKIGVDVKNWTMCYPYGGYDMGLIKLLVKYKCKLGLTTNVDVAILEKSNCYELPRLDTNDFPKSQNAKNNNWYLKG